MIALAYYLLKVFVCSALLFAYYFIALKNKPFHYYNRYYLLGVASFSWLIPLIKIDIASVVERTQAPILQYAKVIADNNAEFEQIVVQHQQSFNWDQLILIVVCSISVMMLISFLYSLGKIFMIIKRNPVQRFQNLDLVLTTVKGTPFSFFSNIFWHKDTPIQSSIGQQMLKHELVHVSEKHSADKIFVELMMIVGWVNPIFWFLKKELYLIHEFIADQKSIEHHNVSLLAEMLLTAAYPQQANRLSNPFFFSPIKRRIAMISSNKSTRFTYLRRILILPVLATVVFLLAFRYVQKEVTVSIIPLKKTYTVVIDAGHGGDDTGIKLASGETEKDLVLSLVTRMKALNENANIKIVLNRDNDVFIPVDKRHDKTLKLQADLFVSMHINASVKNSNKQSHKSGMEIYVPDSISTYYKPSMQLANAINQSCAGIFQLNIIGVRKMPIWVLKASPCPAVLIETGYMNYPQDLKTIKERKDDIARKVLAGIELYLKSTE